MPKISAVVSAFNEEENIVDCLSSLNWVDEIILVDNSSQDNTVKLARQFGKKVKVFRRPNLPMLNINKNFGFSQASGEWILNLDADERVSPPLKKEIQQTLSRPQADGYLIPRKNIIFGRWIRHGPWYPDEQLRLFRKGKGRFPEKHIHEKVVVKGKVGRLKHHLIHYNYRTVSQYLTKMTQIYVPAEVAAFLKKGKKVYWYDALRFPTQDFIKNFLALQGYKDGLHGLVLALLQAFYQFLVLCHLWEKQGFRPFAPADFLDRTVLELKNTQRQLRYWLIQQKPWPKIFKKVALKLNSLRTPRVPA